MDSLCVLVLGLVIPLCLACGDCYGRINHIEHVRHVKRIQPGVPEATYGPKRSLEWGQTDTHGWLEGHLKEKNYGADWGDFVSFSQNMKHRARDLGVDLLVLDTGDLHDGTGLSDMTTPNGEISMKIFERLDYDLLTIGNHELLLADVAYQTFTKIAKFWGDKYLTSNVQIFNPASNSFEYIGNPFKYFVTGHGLRIMAFGVLFDFTRNTNVSRIIKAKDLVSQDWFQRAINFTQPIDMFLVLGHNPVRSSIGGTFGVVHEAIRKVHPLTPIQIFGGHTHVRDFSVLDESTTAIESGRYCETLGWVSMSGFNKSNSAWIGSSPHPRGVTNPTRKAIASSRSPFKYSRRYLDWNRATFEYHAVRRSNNQHSDQCFDQKSGLGTTAEISKYRTQLGLSKVIGCAPKNYCMTCAPINSSESIFPLLSQALAEVVINEDEEDIPRYIISNTGGIRLDMHKGPFTNDDLFTISPSRNALLYIPRVPCSKAVTLLDKLNDPGISQKQDIASMRFEYDLCVDPDVVHLAVRDGSGSGHALQRMTKRQEADLAPGYTTNDDFGSDGDDTTHSSIPYYVLPNYYQGVAGLGEDGCTDVANVVFVDFAKNHILDILGPEYSSSNVSYYIGKNYTTRDFLPQFVKQSNIFQAGMPHCKVGLATPN